MAYDGCLANRIREVMEGERGLSEKNMFGGPALLIDDKMAVSAALGVAPETFTVLRRPH